MVTQTGTTERICRAICMAGGKSGKLQLALCTSSTCYIMESTVPVPNAKFSPPQTTRQKRLAHGDNAIAYFLCYSVFQPEQTHLIPSSIL